MKLYKYDIETATVCEVEGEPYPGLDSDGEHCFTNTHFPVRDDAIARLRQEILASVSLAGYEVRATRCKLRKAEGWAGEAAEQYAEFQRKYPEKRKP